MGHARCNLTLRPRLWQPGLPAPLEALELVRCRLEMLVFGKPAPSFTSDSA